MPKVQPYYVPYCTSATCRKFLQKERVIAGLAYPNSYYHYDGKGILCGPVIMKVVAIRQEANLPGACV